VDFSLAWREKKKKEESQLCRLEEEEEGTHILATQKHLLEQEDVVLSIRVSLGGDELIVDDQLPEGFRVVSLPVLDSSDEFLRRCSVLLLSRSLVDLVGDPLDASESRHDGEVVLVVVGSSSFDERLIEKERERRKSARRKHREMDATRLTLRRRGYLVIR